MGTGHEKEAAVRIMLSINGKDLKQVKKFCFIRSRLVIEDAMGHWEMRTMVMGKEIFHKRSLNKNVQK